MTTRSTYLSLALGSALALAAACGGNDESSGPSGGTGGTAPASSGTTSGGSNNTAGTTPVGGTNVGGSSAEGGAGTMMPAPGCPAEKPTAGEACMRRGGFGAGACTYGEDSCVCDANAWACYSQADCPASAPADAEACDLNGMSCTYGTLGCTCSTMNGWTCQEPCPQAEPADDTECRRPAAAACRYQAGMVVQGFMGMADATCACNDGKFSCFTQEDCPAEAPATGDACDMTTLSCAFTGERCTCGADGAWACTTDCPATLPADGDACERSPQQACRYNGDMLSQGMQSDATCRCNDMKFDCLTQADCPTTQPVNATACELPGLTCGYDTEDCRCGTMSGMWNCFGGNPGTGGAGSGGANGAGGAQ